MAVSDKKPSGSPQKKEPAAPKALPDGQPVAKPQAEEAPRRPHKNYVLRRRIRSFIGFLGFLLVLVGAWIIYHWVVTGKPPDLGTERGRQEALGTLKEDAKKVAEKAKEAYAYSLDEIQQRMKEPPPKTKEEIQALVKESGEETQKSEAAAVKTPDAAETKSGTPGEPRVTNLPPPKKEEPAPTGYYGEALADYQRGSKAYALTDPANAQETVQVNLRIAKHFFERSLNAIDRARAGGQGSPQLDQLEVKVTKRLFDCTIRLELNPGYDRKAEAELRKLQ
ncbi:MAG: hypothetical protein HY291_11205 [Planctomycetes bacterium]|nr:hypothetical protein [Planctomycetota bacterium]